MKLTQAEVFDSLARLYQELDSRTGGASGNPCGQCRACCTSSGLNSQNVTELEFDFIKNRVGSEKVEHFRDFVVRDGKIELCPYFDEDSWGCGIYPVRPYSCRVFGHYRERATALPKLCVFEGQEHLFDQSEFYEELPLAKELRELNRSYWPFKTRRESKEQAPCVIPPLSQSDELDAAMLLLADDKPEEALETLMKSEVEDSPYSLYCASLILETLGNNGEALRALNLALEEAPDCISLLFRAACNHYALGQWELGCERADQLRSLDPEHLENLIMFSGALIQMGKKDRASETLQAAERLSPGHPTVANFRKALN